MAANIIKQIAMSCYSVLPDSLQDTVAERYVRYKQNRIGRLFTPTVLIFFITSRCNARCAHCFYWQELNSGASELSLDDIGRTARSLRHRVHLSLTGGEPFLRQDVGEICRIFHKENGCRNIGIATNGFLTDRITETCGRIAAGLPLESFSVQVSLDGLEQTHNSIRGVKNGFESAVNTIRELAALADKYPNFKVNAAFVIQKKNINEAEDLVRFLLPLKVPVKFGLVRGKDYGTYQLPEAASSEINPKEEDSPVVAPGELEEVFRRIGELNSKAGFWSERQQEKIRLSLKMMKEKKSQLPCFAGRLDAVLYSNGDLALCELTKPVGNLKDYEYDMAALWKSETAENMRKHIRRCFCIHGCNLATSMMFNPSLVKSYFKNSR